MTSKNKIARGKLSCATTSSARWPRRSPTATTPYAELEEKYVDLKKQQGWLAKIRMLNFYGAERAVEAKKRLKGCADVLDDHGRRVFDAHDENR